MDKLKQSRIDLNLKRNPNFKYLYDTNLLIEYLNKLTYKPTRKELAILLNVKPDTISKYTTKEFRDKYLRKDNWHENETEEHKQKRITKMSNSMKDIWSNYTEEDLKNRKTMKGYKHNTEIRKKISENTKKAMSKIDRKHLVKTKIDNLLKDNPNRKYIYDENLLIEYINNLEYKPTMLQLSRLLNIPYTTLAYSISNETKTKYLSILSTGRSTIEKDVQEFIENILNIKLIANINLNTRKVIAPLELDIYLPEYNLAIEVNGDYYHSFEQGTPKDYHYKKYLACKEKGIRLIQIWEHEWNDYRQRPILENIIKHACGLTKNKIYARKCKIKEINGMTDEINNFIDKNNIAGNRTYKDAICLYYNDKLVEVFTIGHAYFGKGKYDIEIIRGASLLDYTTVGGSSKLWNYIINTYMPKNNYKSCVYYVDNNYFNSSSQTTGNMTELKYVTHNISFKNYFIKTGEIKNRDPRHNKEIKKLIETGEVITLYNAGSDVYVYRKS